MKPLNEFLNESKEKFTKEDLIKLHKLSKGKSFKTFKQYKELRKDLFGDVMPSDIDVALQQLVTAKDFVDYVLVGREKDISNFSNYKIDPRFDKSKLGY